MLDEVRRAARLIDSGLWSFATAVQGAKGRRQFEEAAAASNDARKQVLVAIKEAREASRRRRLKVVLFLLSLAVIVVLAIAIGSGRTNPKKATTGDLANSSVSPPPTCLRSQIRVSFVGDGAGLGNGAFLIRVNNVSGKACSVTGFPTFTGIFASGVQRTFKDTLNGYMGGLGTDPSSTAEPPVVVLRSRRGVATSMVEAVENGRGPNPTCPGFTSYVIALPHVTDAYTFHSRWPDLYCFDREVHPLLPGTTGNAK